MEPSLALHRLDDNGRRARGVDVRLEQEGEVLERVVDAYAELRPREWHMVDFRLRRPEPLLVGEHLSGHVHRQDRAAMERAGESDDGGAAGRGPGDLDRILGRLGAGGEERRLGRARDRRQGVQAFGQLHIDVVKRHLKAGVGEALHLLSGRGHDLRVTMTRIDDRYASGEIDIALAFHVPNLGISRPRREDSGRMADCARHRCFAAAKPLPVAREAVGV